MHSRTINARFVLIGAAGYVAPRHMKAISEMSGDLVTAYDVNDSVGVIDSRFAMRCEADAICEKSVVLNPWNIDGLSEMEAHTGKRVYSILQLRPHLAIIALKEEIAAQPDKVHEVDLSYITSRGQWYHTSWKGNAEKTVGYDDVHKKTESDTRELYVMTKL